MFSQKNKSEYVLEFIRTLPKSKKTVASLYLFPPAEAEHLPELLDRTEWNARPVDFRYRILGIQEDKKQHTERSVSLLSPYCVLSSLYMPVAYGKPIRFWLTNKTRYLAVLQRF